MCNIYRYRRFCGAFSPLLFDAIFPLCSGHLRALHPKLPLLSHPQLKGTKMCKRRGKAAPAAAAMSPISSSSSIKLSHQAAQFHLPIRYIPSGKATLNPYSQPTHPQPSYLSIFIPRTCTAQAPQTHARSSLPRLSRPHSSGLRRGRRGEEHQHGRAHVRRCCMTNSFI